MTTIPQSTLFWTSVVHPAYPSLPLYAVATELGICRLTWPHESMDDVTAWAAKHMPNTRLIKDDERMSLYAAQLQEYFRGERTGFDLPLDMRGTAFQREVWKALTAIPYGETRSYSAIAAAIGKPSAVRAVGSANGANPVPVIVPCHRVIGKNNALTGFRGGLHMKEELLRLEGYYDYKAAGHARFQF
ncbi:methylated-DNA--[protein]-cysteine S-methyltransferase [Paenibacillus sp. J5C_2022]|uniref:methylated-DNA--[protein]-cysteine S-methyltransferase n=1 Tax=Paenibacillus sp. J5C2022 TaxID=2977129 RepID=UPI0021CF2018|nr:methylated-DNA--[protein]-cysteine S-methyltransferase [Paenibacillus sp. J5C2022]MCU6708250.1 methylated-DNA--[protein]-cysteine S-methyltransferase [Paenibacillus sp. J5C2022]